MPALAALFLNFYFLSAYDTINSLPPNPFLAVRAPLKTSQGADLAKLNGRRCNPVFRIYLSGPGRAQISNNCVAMS